MMAALRKSLKSGRSNRKSRKSSSRSSRISAKRSAKKTRRVKRGTKRPTKRGRSTKRPLNDYMLALQKARNEGADSFKYKGKTYKGRKLKTGLTVYKRA